MQLGTLWISAYKSAMSRILLLIDPSPARETVTEALRRAEQTPVDAPDGWKDDAWLVERVAEAEPDVVVLDAEQGLDLALRRCRKLMNARATCFVPAVVVLPDAPDPELVTRVFNAGARDLLWLGEPLDLLGARIDNMARLNYLRRTFRRQNDALAARTAELDQVFETATTGLAIADETGHVIRLNATGRAILGDHASPSDLYQLTREDSTRLEDRKHPLRRAVTCGEASSARRYLLPADDGDRVIVLEAVPLEAPGGRLTGGLAVFRDDTETWALESSLRDNARDLARRTDEMEAFVYTAAHDMKSPLWMIRRYAETILEDDAGLAEESRRFLGRVEINAERLGNLVEDLVQVVKVGKLELHLDACDLGAVMRAVLSELDGQIQEAGATVVVADDLPTVFADFDRLLDVFGNLVSNAVKYRRPDVPCRIEIGQLADQRRGHIFVRDNGIGVHDDHHKRIFQLFHRLHTRDQIEGSGLGLAIVTRIVQRHGGRVWVESSPGEGSTFHVHLPLQSEPPT